MENKYKIKQVVIIIIIIVVLGSMFLSIYSKKQEMVIAPNTNIVEKKEEKKSVNLCFYNSNKTKNNLYDVSLLKLNILDDNVTGEFKNIPAEKDSKVGKFAGTVGPLIPEIMGRRADVWWDSFAEGMNVKEELILEFGDGSATVGFGEMIDRGDGVYVYKDKTKLTYLDSMSQIDCESLDERLSVEKYIKNNIKILAINKPVLGGSWYVVSVFVAPVQKTGEVVYEDGHIQSKANFTYTYNKNPESVVVTKFEVK